MGRTRFDDVMEADDWMRLKEDERQVVVLALAALSLQRPGWVHYLGTVAMKFRGMEMYDEFRNPESVKARKLQTASRVLFVCPQHGEIAASPFRDFAQGHRVYCPVYEYAEAEYPCGKECARQMVEEVRGADVQSHSADQ